MKLGLGKTLTEEKARLTWEMPGRGEEAETAGLGEDGGGAGLACGALGASTLPAICSSMISTSPASSTPSSPFSTMGPLLSTTTNGLNPLETSCTLSLLVVALVMLSVLPVMSAKGWEGGCWKVCLSGRSAEVRLGSVVLASDVGLLR